MRSFIALILGVFSFGQTSSAATSAEMLNKPAPSFELKNQKGEVVKLADRKGKGWTVLFFYPKAGTPGCTTQVCAFRDSVSVIQKLNTAVYGISTDSVSDQKKFHDKHKLTFDLLSDADVATTKNFNVATRFKMAMRTTFIVDDQLTIRKVLENVDPALDAKNVAQAIQELQAKK